jgi:hypothetical protein
VGKPGLRVDEYCPNLIPDLHSQRFRTFIPFAAFVAAARFIGENIPFKSCLMGTI